MPERGKGEEKEKNRDDIPAKFAPGWISNALDRAARRQVFDVRRTQERPRRTSTLDSPGWIMR